MGKEIETKVPLTKDQFYKAFRILSGQEYTNELSVKGFSLLFKSDAYFSQYNSREERLSNEPKVIRIRKERFYDDSDVQVQITKNALVKDCDSLLSQRDEYLSGANYKEDSYFTIKHKALENGVEFNQEYETKIESPEVLEKFFESTKFNKWFCKEKICFSSYVKMNIPEVLEFHAELETVFNLPYLEIEYTQETDDAAKVKKQLEKCIALLGADPSSKDNLSWIEIINKIKK